MIEKRYVVPEGMLKAADAEQRVNVPTEVTLGMLEAALR